MIVTDTVEKRDAFETEIGTVYGPPPTRNSGPGGVTRICAGLGGVTGPGGVTGTPAATPVVPGCSVLPGGTTATDPLPAGVTGICPGAAVDGDTTTGLAAAAA